MKKKTAIIIVIITIIIVICILSPNAIKSSINQILKEDPAGSAQETSGGLVEDMNGNLSGVSDKVIYDDPDDIAEDGMLKEYIYEDQSEWVKENWPKEYEMLTTADWDMENDVWHNDNIQIFLPLYYGIEERPGTFYREVPWDAFVKDPEKFYGARIWYNAIYLNKIEMIPGDDERAQAVNNGKECVILHTSIKEGDGKDILIFITGAADLNSYYNEDDIGTRISVPGWYVGHDEDGNPVLCHPAQSGG